MWDALGVSTGFTTINTLGDQLTVAAGMILGIVRDKYEKITVDFIEIELDKKINRGARTKVLVRTRDAHLRDDGNINVKYSKDQLKVMSKEQELQRHPPTI